MSRVNVNLFPVEYDRAAGELTRSVVSQLVNADVGTTPICPRCPLTSSSRCGDLRTSPPSTVIRPLFLPSLYVISLFLTSAWFIDSAGGNYMWMYLFLRKATSLSTFLASCWDRWKRSENQMCLRISRTFIGDTFRLINIWRSTTLIIHVKVEISSYRPPASSARDD